MGQIRLRSAAAWHALACGAVLSSVYPSLSNAATAAADAVDIATTVTLDTIEVVGQTPLPAGGIAARDYAGNLQTATADAIRDAQSDTIATFMAQQLSGVHVSEAASNPFQPDLFYRGYSVSPLLGLPQGLAVYQDGVRINEVFGDTVNWDLVPEMAIDDLALIPDSNPLYGQNALGGSIALRSKSGFDHPGASLEVSSGSFGRLSTDAEYGLASTRSALYVAARATREDGWRDDSGSDLHQLFARGSWRPDDAGQVDLSVTAADNALRGNGAVPEALMDAEGRDAVFTHPDETRPQLLFVNLFGQRTLSATLEAGGNVYLRRNTVHTFNGDGTEYFACQDAELTDDQGNAYLCEEEDEQESVVRNLAGDAVVASAANDSATQNRSRTRQQAIGAGVQLVAHWHPAHRLTFGGSVDRGRADFASGTELAALTDSRGTAGSGTEVEDAVVHVKTRSDNLGLYIADLWQIGKPLQLSLGGRYNHTEVELRDQQPDGDLNGHHRFDRFNPMAGATYRLSAHWTAFGSASQATRAPTPVELTCANPDDPCRLPNGFVDDPPLKQVLTRTVSIGLRQQHATLRSSMALFHADSRDDILFISDGNLTNEGYFDNVGKTRRQGLELAVQWTPQPSWSFNLQYTFIAATFEDDFLVSTPNHPLHGDSGNPAADETRHVANGNRIPLIPRHLINMHIGWNPAYGSLRLEAVGRSNSRYRGDEANVDDHQLGGFVLLNLYGELKPSGRLTLFGRIDNMLDREYATFGTYGEADEVLGDDYEDARRFIGPGTPRAVYVGIRLSY